MDDAWLNNHQLFRDLRETVDSDSYLWMVVHGPPRSSKTTLALWCAYSLYRDWHTALKATVFSLPSVIHRIRDEKILPRWPSRNNLHMRIPCIIYDDFGVSSNKAYTQHSIAWDQFKGASDALGTELGILIATMVDAGEATSQLQNKYQAELIVNSKGKYKYDQVEWLQDYKGFRSKIKKTWIQNGKFPPMPEEFYREYDQMRIELTKEAFIRISDAFSVDYLDQSLRMIKESDIELLRLIDNRGPIKYDIARDVLGEDYKLTLTRCRARDWIISTCVGPNQYRLDLGSLGKDILDALDKQANITTQKIPARID